MIFKLRFLIIVSLFSLASSSEFIVKAQQNAKTKIVLAFIGKALSFDDEIVERIRQDLQYSGQVEILLRSIKKNNGEMSRKKLKSDDATILLTISKGSSFYEWKLFDLLTDEITDSDLLLSGKSLKKDRSASSIAHDISDQVWPGLIGEPSSFSSKIAFSKQIWKKKYGELRPLKQIWVSDFDGTNQKLLIDVPTVSFAPCWSQKKDSPLLFYSENSLSNVQLIMSNMFGKRHMMCSFEGLNMQPTFSPDGKMVAFCLSKDGSSQLYLSFLEGPDDCRRLTFNDANNISPCFIDNRFLLFVSDMYVRPQLYIIDLKTNSIERITDGNYSACPSYSKTNHKIVYSKMVEGLLQLFEYDLKSRKHVQITKGPGSKEEASWSECGNYITFGLNDRMSSRIAQINRLTGKIRYLTSSKEHCTYPRSSPVYSVNIGILS